MVVTVRLTDSEWAEIDRIPGWLSKDEADLLYELCQSPWCEVGSWVGRSVNVLAKKGPGWAVEWFKGNPESFPISRVEFLGNTQGLDFTLVDGDFRKAADRVGELRFLHLDADHSYEGTKKAFDLYSPKLARGCFLVLHDVWPEEHLKELPYPGVYRFATELMQSKDWLCVGGVGRSAAFRKL